MRVKLPVNGIQLLFVALLLGLASGFVWFPVWSTDGSGTRILLAFVTVQPLAFLLERLLPSAVIVGFLGVVLVEGARQEAREPGLRWNRERLAIALAVGAVAVLLGYFATRGSGGSIVFGNDGFFFPFLMYATVNVVFAVGSGLYLFWTADRIAGSSVRRFGSAAFAFGCVAAALGAVTLNFVFLGSPTDDSRTVLPWLDVGRWLLGEISLALWIMAYVGVFRVTHAAPVPSAVVSEA